MKAATENRTRSKPAKVNTHDVAEQFLKRAIPGLEDCTTMNLELAKVILSIDKFFGYGFAQKNPNLVAAALQAHARLDNCYGNIEDALNNIGNGLSELAAKERA